MNRLEKKCFIAATGLHVLLFVVVICGTAFGNHDEPNTIPPLKAIPTRLVDAALSGGGGNPKAAPSDAQQKGQTLTPPPIQPAPPPPPTPQPRHVEPARPVASKSEPRVDKPKPVKPPKEPIREVPRPVADAKAKTSKTDEIILKPIIRTTTDKVKEKADAEAKAAADAAAAASKKAAREFAKAAQELRAGFTHGTAVQIPFGVGGEAYANYAQFVKSVYEDAWVVTDDLTDEDSTAKVSVTIARSGRVISAHIERPSGNSALDKSVQRALDKVSFVREFPPESHDEQRTFVINFNLKSKRLLG